MAAAELPAARADLAQACNRQLTVAAPAGLGSTAYWDAARRAGLNKRTEAMFARVIAADPKDAGIVEWRARYRAAATGRDGALADYTVALAIEPTIARCLNRSGTGGFRQF